MSNRDPSRAVIPLQRRSDEGSLRRETIDRLSATLSHQLRNPLGALRNYLYAVEHEVERPELEAIFARAHGCIERCVAVIDGIGAYGGGAVVRRDRVDIDVWLREVLSNYRVPEQVRLLHELGASGVEVEIDTDRFTLAVTHLLDNASESLDGGGMIEVSTRVEDGAFVLVVIDEGSGLPAGPVDPFEPFYTTKLGRLGLGLELVELIVRAHGGEVSLGARADRTGTRARIRVPVAG